MTLATTNQGNTTQGNNLMRWESHGAQVALSTIFVRKHFCPAASHEEAFAFLRFCEAHRLNPFLKDAYLVKYSANDPAQIIIAAHTWTKRASVDPQYAGHKVGIIVQKDGVLERRESLFYTPDEQVVGGWADIEKTDGTSYRTEVAIQERQAYKKDKDGGGPTSFWARMPATMIAKCALADGMRNAFPVLFSGAYDQAEIGETHIPLEGGITIEGEAATMVDLETGEILPVEEGAEEERLLVAEDNAEEARRQAAWEAGESDPPVEGPSSSWLPKRPGE